MKYLLQIYSDGAMAEYGRLSADGQDAIAARIPAARLGGAIEVRPLVER